LRTALRARKRSRLTGLAVATGGPRVGFSQDYLFEPLGIEIELEGTHGRCRSIGEYSVMRKDRSLVDGAFENCCKRLLRPSPSRHIGEVQNTEFQCFDNCLGAIRYAQFSHNMLDMILGRA
jgi:hypothetical protein